MREQGEEMNFLLGGFSEEDIKGISNSKLYLNKDRSEILDQMPGNARYVLYVIEKLDEDK